MEAPPLIDLLRDHRARIASAALTPGQAARTLAADARFDLMHTYGLQDTDHAQEMTQCLAVLLIERATPPAQGQEGR